jgi:hypothetical protein
VIDQTAIRAFKPNGEPAPFSGTASYISGNQLTGSPNQPFTGPHAVAVDSRGDIYVADFFFTHVYAPTGEALAEFFAAEANLLGVDPTGVVYVGSSQGLEAQKPSEYPVTSTTGYSSVPITATSGASLGVDSGNGQLYVGDTSVRQYASQSAGGALLGEFGSEQLAGGSAAGVTVDRSSGPNAGDVYVSTGAQVDRFGPSVTAPEVVTEPATVNSVTQPATLNGTVNPEGVAVTECEFEYGPNTVYGQTVECAGGAASVGSGGAPVSVTAGVTGLAPGNYHFRLVAGNADAGSKGSDRTFAIIGPPLIEGESAEAAHTEAQLMATINPGNSPVVYRFEYGTTTAYGSTTQTATLPAGTAPAQAGLGIVGLQPGTTYHFRVVAGNAFETVVGPDATFTTELGSVAGSCSNEALRIGFSALLPECRAYEMVSPVNKNGGAVYPKYNTQSTIDGNAIEFLSTTAFAGAPANIVNPYVATRGESGWETKPIGSPQSNPKEFVEFTSPATSEDLTKSLTASREALTPGAIAGGSNLYLRNNVTGALILIASEPGSTLFSEFNGNTLSSFYNGGTSNFSRIFFSSPLVLDETEGAIAGANNVYEFANGVLSIPTVPEGNGSVPAAGAILSTGGHRLFLVNPAGVWFVSDNGGTPVPITLSDLAGSKGEPVVVTNFVPSADGSTAYFNSQEPLVEEGGNPVSQEGLYRLDVNTGALTDLTPTKPARMEFGIQRVSANGSAVFFLSKAPLAPGSSEPPNSGVNIFVWHAGEFQLIVQTNPEIFPVTVGEESEVSPNGKLYVFTSSEPFPPTTARNPRCENELCREVYAFSLDSGHLSCASCSNAPSRGPASLDLGRPVISNHSPRSVLDNGDVFFNTPTSLASRDTNGVGDVYMWRDGKSSLISTGTSPDESTFAEATPDGRDVFFRTTQRLVGIDVDSAGDLYDARVEGGIAGQNPGGAPPPCEGSDCRGSASSPPPPLSSSVHEGRCEAFGKRAHKVRAKAKRLAKKAAAASGKDAEPLHRRAAKVRKQAKQLNKKANQCRRRGK